MELGTQTPTPQPKRGVKALVFGLLGVAAVSACIFSSGALPMTASAVVVEHVPSQLEMEVTEDLSVLMAKAERIMQDPAKLKYLAQRIKQVLADPAFQAKVKAEMQKLQKDEAFYEYLRAMLAPESARRLGAAYAAPAIRGAAPSAYRAPAMQMQEAAPAAPVEEATPPPFQPEAFAKTLPGITAPLGFFDPMGFCANDAEQPVTEGKIRFYREVEIKHCRVAMLAALGYPLAEVFHPLFGGNVDTPSFIAFQQTPLQTFWPAVVFLIAIPEVFSVFTFQNPVGSQPWTIRTDHMPGDLGWDPLGLKPTNPAELAEMQTKELNNGRLAMIAIAGMIVQEGVTGGKLF
jgi:hypothetical protein